MVAADRRKRNGLLAQMREQAFRTTAFFWPRNQQQAAFAVIEFPRVARAAGFQAESFPPLQWQQRLAFAAYGHGGEFTHEVRIHYLWPFVKNLAGSGGQCRQAELKLGGRGSSRLPRFSETARLLLSERTKRKWTFLVSFSNKDSLCAVCVEEKIFCAVHFF